MSASGRWWQKVVLTLATAICLILLGTPGVLNALQQEAKQDQDKSKPKRKTAGLRVPGGRVPKNKQAPAADPLKAGQEAVPGQAAPAGNAAPAPKAGNAKAKQAAQAAANQPQVPLWPFHYTLKLEGADGAPLSATYYPARESFEAPVVILLHESGTGRASKDFTEPIEDLKGKTFAQHLQEQGYAVFVLNLRGRPDNANLSATDWRIMIGDVQNAYRFLIDRHNRGELNLARLGLVALGDGANLAVAWAASPGGGVSNEGRLSDIGAIVLVSPVAEIPGVSLARTLPTIATRFPLLALSGDRDQASIQVVRDNQRVIERHRLSRTAFYDTPLHGGKLLIFFPKVPGAVERFLDDPVKLRKVDWEPRFLLDPVACDDVQLVPDSGFAAFRQNPNQPAPAAKDAAPKDQPKDAAAKKRRP